MDIGHSMIGICRRARALVRPAAGTLALAVMAACSADGDSTQEKTGEAESAVLSGVTFEGSDGNLVRTGSNTDWENAPNRFAGIDRQSGSTDNAFGQGAKEDDTTVTVVAGSIPPNKNDLTRFYVASEVRGGDNFVYLAWERATNTGSANLDFEINQSATAGFTSTTTGAVNLNRTAGDLLITYDFSGSGAPVLGLNVWLTAAAGNTAGQCFSANSLPCWGKHQNLSGANSEGAVNTTSVTDPISVPGAPAPNPPGSLGVGLFGEAAINLTKAGAFGAGTCESFGSGFVKSRSSPSFTAEVKDFIAPIAPLGISNCTIALTKTVNDPTQKAKPGDVLTYTLTYTNPNEAPLTNVVISDPLPANTTFVSVASAPSIACTAPAVGAAGTVSCTIPTLGIGATGTVTIAAKLASVFPAGDTTVTNVATLSSKETPSVTAQAVKVVAAAPALAISKTVDKTIAAPGDSLTYVLTYANNGTANATNVVVSDALPAKTKFVSVSSSPSLTCTAPAAGSSGTVSCTVPTLAVGATGTVTVKVQLDAVFPEGRTTVANTAVINDTPSTPVTTNVDAAPALAIAKAVDKTAASPGDVLVYTLDYSNKGNADATGVVISDTLPARTTFVSVTSAPSLACSAPAVGAPGTVSCTVPTLAAGGSGTVTITVKLDPVFPSGATTVINKAFVNTTESNPVSTTVTAAPALAITKGVNRATASPGDQLVYTLTYSNSGNADATDAVVSDTLPARTTFVSVTSAPSITCTAPAAGSPGTVSCTVPTLAAGGTGTVTITVKLDPVFPSGGTTVINTGFINGAPSNPVTTSVSAAPSLAVTKAVDKTTAAPGDQLVYTLSYSNTGNADASGVTITDTLPAQTTFVAVASSPSLSCTAPAVGSGGVVSCSVATLAAGGTGTVTLTVKLAAVFPSGVTMVTNTAVINATPSNPVTTSVSASPSLSITKSVDRASAAPGDLLTYTLSYTNSGNAAASGVTISDVLPPKTTFVSLASAPAISCTAPAVGSAGTVSCSVPTLAAGGTGTVTLTVKLDPVFPTGTTIVTNTAVINATPSNPATTTVGAAPDLAIAKAVNKTTASPGDTLVYTLSYANSGDADASDVNITDLLPARTTFVSVSSTPSLTCTTPAVGAGGTVGCTIPTLAAGATGTVTLTVKLDPVFPTGTTAITNVAEIEDTPSNPVTTSVGAAPVLTLSKVAAPATEATQKFVNQASAGSAQGVSASATSNESTVVTGSTIVYTLTLGNTGNADATGVSLTDVIPTGLVFVSAVPQSPMSCTTPAVGSPGMVSCTLATLASGASRTLVLTVRTQ